MITVEPLFKRDIGPDFTCSYRRKDGPKVKPEGLLKKLDAQFIREDLILQHNKFEIVYMPAHIMSNPIADIGGPHENN